MDAPGAPLLAPPAALAEAAARAVDAARREGTPRLLGWSEPCAPLDLLRFLAAGEVPRVGFLAPEGDQLAGRGEAVTLTASGEGRFDAIRLQAEALTRRAIVASAKPSTGGAGGAAGAVGAAGPAGAAGAVAVAGAVAARGAAKAPSLRFLGGFAFADEHTPTEGWDRFPAALFLLPRVAVTRTASGTWLSVNQLVDGHEDPPALARQIAQLATRAASPPALQAGSAASPGVPLPPFGTRIVERASWDARMRDALLAIRRGELRKVVLARRVPVPLTAPLQGPAALARLGERYADCFRFLVEPAAGRAFFGASPELLVRWDGSDLESAALAGSAPRGVDAAEDAELGRALQASPKERAEHDLVVQHVATRLRELQAEVHAPAEPGLLRLRNVQHLHTPFRGTLKAPLHVLDLVAALHPTPAVAGEPPARALAHLARTEGFARGWYAGPVGWFDAEGHGAFAVALRCARVEPTEAMLFAGAGIVAGADPEHEWRETELKLQPMLEALGCR